MPTKELADFKALALFITMCYLSKSVVSTLTSSRDDFYTLKSSRECTGTMS